MALKVIRFGSYITYPVISLKKVSKCRLVERIKNWLAFKEN
jgi:hypothetical protein